MSETMICLFPDPYPYELLYSACARYGALMQYPNKSTATEDFFGKGATAIVDIPGRLDYLIRSLPPNHLYTVDELIDKHTIFPFYASYLPKNLARLIRQAMRFDDCTMAGARIGRTPQGRKMSCLRFCPECAREDRKAFGETYWHRLHQLRGVDSCYHHDVFLEDTEALWQNDKHPVEAKAAEFYVKDTRGRRLNTSNPVHLIHSKMAQVAYFLLNNVRDSVDCKVLSSRYKNLLLRQGLAHYNGQVRRTKLIDRLKQYYSEEILIKFGCNFGTGKSWVNRLLSLRQEEDIPAPLCHILLLVFLNCTPEELFDGFVEFKPFGDGPWPCLNPAGGHYKESKVLSCTMLPGTKKFRGKPRGVFGCSCGFVYARIGPDTREEDRFTYSIVQTYGTLWESLLRELWDDETFSIDQIASSLCVSTLTLKRRVVSLGLRFPRSIRTPGVKIEILGRYKLRRRPRQALLRQKKKELLALVTENPQLSRSDLWGTNFSLIHYIQRADPRWMDQHLPPPREPYIPRRPKVNWEEEDVLLAKAVAAAISEINEIDPPARITLAAVTERVGHPTRLRSFLQKMPRTAAILKTHIESTEDYFVRRINWAEDAFRRERVIPMKSAFVDRAQIGRYKVSGNQVICQAMEEALARLSAHT
jgi:hypothetical protein